MKVTQASLGILLATTAVGLTPAMTNSASAANPCLEGKPDPVAFGVQEIGSTTVIKLTVTEANCVPAPEIKILRENGEGSAYLKLWAAGKDECLGRKFVKQGETCTTEFSFEPGEAGSFELLWLYEYNGGTYEVLVTGSTPALAWLANGAAITAALASVTEGAILLEDNNAPIVGKAAVLCSDKLGGTVGPNVEDKITEIQNSKGEKIGELGGLALLGEGAGTDCVTETGCAEGSATSPIEVFPTGLPWASKLIQEGGKVYDLISSTTNLGYELLCLILGINTEDQCTIKEAKVEVINDSITGDAETPSGALVTPNSNCTQGGTGSGVDQADELTTITLVSGELLSV